MRTIKVIIASILIICSFLSCEKENSVYTPTPTKRDYQSQYDVEKVLIEEYLKTHAVTVVDNPGFSDDQDVIFTVVPSLDATSIWGSDPLVPNANLLTKLVTVEGVVHKAYYLKFRDGIGTSPTSTSQIKAYYKMFLLNSESTVVTSSVEEGINLSINSLVLCWQYILPEFKMGTIIGTNDYNDFGAGVMFIPSALAYYDMNLSNVPPYSPVIYNFKLFNVF